MQANYERQYTSKKGTDVFVYSVEGTDAELANYKKAQGKNFREDKETGKSLWFTTRYVGEITPLIITSKGSVIADLREMKKHASLVEQFGGNLGQAMANAAAASLLGTKPTPAPKQDVEQPQADASPEGLDNL